MKVVIGTGCGTKSNRFFAARDLGVDDDEYFHIDGVFRYSTFNEETSKYDGYWNSREELEKSLKEKFPDVQIEDWA